MKPFGKFKFKLALGIAVLATFASPSTHAEAAQDLVTSTQGDTRIIMLGTAGGPMLRANRAEPSTLLVVNGTYYLFDCGIGALRRMTEGGIDAAAVKTIFITHHHPDHDLDLANILANDFLDIGWSQHDKGVYNVYGPPGTDRMVNYAVQYFGVPFRVFSTEGLGEGIGPDFDPRMRSHFVAHDIAHSGLVYQDKNIRVTAVENSHFDLMPDKYRATEKSYSYRIETPKAVIVITGDTGPSKALTEFARGADVLVTEVMDLQAIEMVIDKAAKAGNWPPQKKEMGLAHMQREHSSPEVVRQLASAAHVKSVVLYHFGPELDHKVAGVEAVIASIKTGFDGQVIAANDLDNLCVNAGHSESSVLMKCK